jgi:adenylosuccinate lyase
MPHKKNPMVGERLCGMARLLRGYAVTALENVPLWHERDISHSSAERVILPDATIALDYMLVRLERLVRKLRVLPDRMQANLELTHGLVHSQQVLLALTESGVSREAAYRMVQRNAVQCWESGRDLKELMGRDPDIVAHLSPADLDAAFELQRHFRDVNRTFRGLGL